MKFTLAQSIQLKYSASESVLLVTEKARRAHIVCEIKTTARAKEETKIVRN